MGNDMTPLGILKDSFLAYCLAQACIWAGLLYSILFRQADAILFFWMNAGLVVFAIWSTYRRCRTSWLRANPNPWRDFHVPLLVVLSICSAANVATRHLVGAPVVN